MDSSGDSVSSGLLKREFYSYISLRITKYRGFINDKKKKKRGPNQWMVYCDTTHTTFSTIDHRIIWSSG